METEYYTSYGAIPFHKEGNRVLFLIIKHFAGHWGFPKGHQDEGERPVETARRELYEETGLKKAKIIEDIKFEEHYDYEKDEKKFHKTVEYFLTEAESMKNKTPDEFKNEIEDIKWVSFEEGMKTITFDEGKNVLKEAYEKIRLIK